MRKFLLPDSASEHGDSSIDRMFNITLLFTGIVFIAHPGIAVLLLFPLQAQRRNTRFYFYPHNNRLEYVWTIIPAIVLTYLVLGGFKTWSNITKNPDPKTAQIEVFAFQFGWTARYPVADNQLAAITLT